MYISVSTLELPRGCTSGDEEPGLFITLPCPRGGAVLWLPLRKFEVSHLAIYEIQVDTPVKYIDTHPYRAMQCIETLSDGRRLSDALRSNVLIPNIIFSPLTKSAVD